MIWIATRI